MKLKSVLIEGMHNVLEKEYKFNDVNYLYGNNGAGKSTALQAVQLALLGYIPGTNKTGAAIYRHARSKAMTVTAVLISDGGEEISVSRSWIGSGTSVKSTVAVSPKGFPIETIIGELELPIFNFNEFTNMTANKLKEWFIGFLPSVRDEIDWEKELTEALGDSILIDKDVLPNFVKEIQAIAVDRKVSGVDLIKAVNARLKEKISFEKGQLDRLQGTIQSLVFYDDYEVFSDTSEFRQEIKELTDLRSALVKYDSQIQANKEAKRLVESLVTSASSLEDDSEYKSLRVQYKQYTDNIHDLDAKSSGLNAKVAELNAKCAKLRSDIANNSSVTRSGGICPYTSTKCDSVVALIDKLNTDTESMKTELSEYEGKITECQSELRNHRNAHQEISRAASDCMAKMSMIERTYQKKESLLAQLQPDPECPTTMTDADMAARINNLNDIIIKSEANKRYNELTDKLTADKYRCENNIQAYKLWDKLTGANGLQSTLMTQPFVDLAAKMDEYLHVMFNDSTVTTKFNLSEKSNSFSFGLERNGKYIPFDLLSSGEKCLYTIALMMCLTSTSKSMLKLILVDDLLDHLDDGNAKSLFESLYKVKDIQFILAGVQKCNIEHASDILIEVK